MGKSALVLLDLQQGLLERFENNGVDYIARVTEAVKASRTANIPIIWVKTCFRHGHPESSKRNFTTARVASNGSFVEGDLSVEFVKDIAPLENDIVVIKRRVSAFAGTDFECVLRGLEVDSLILAGIATSGAVLSTCRSAADLDYSITIIDELCLDPDEEVHRILMEKVFTRQARTVSLVEWLADTIKR